MLPRQPSDRHLLHECCFRVLPAGLIFEYRDLLRSISRAVSSTLNPDDLDHTDVPDVDRALLAERLRDHRKAAGLAAREAARRAEVRAMVITDLEAGREPAHATDLRHVLTSGYGMAQHDVDDLLFEVGLSQFLAEDLILSPESRRMTLEFARLARMRDRQRRQGSAPPA